MPVESEASLGLVAAVTEEIMVYLKKNSTAGDTPEGIRQWWLSDRCRQVDVGIVEQALQGLAAQGRIGVRMLASGTAFYFGLDPKQRGQT